MRRLSAAASSSSIESDFLTDVLRSVGCGAGGGDALPCESDDLPLETAESLSESLSDLMCDEVVLLTDSRVGILGSTVSVKRRSVGFGFGVVSKFGLTELP